MEPLTTFVQVDTDTFKEVVQRLTGYSESEHDLIAGKGNLGTKKQEFKLHERRQYKSKLEVIKPPLSMKQRAEIVESSPLTTQTKCFSVLSLVEKDTKGESRTPDLNTQEEEKAIKERRFYLHPSPRSKPGFIEPELLTLFPLTSPEPGRES